MRAALAALPDGALAFDDVVDSTGAAADQQRPARIVVTVTVDGDEVTFDFTGTDPQRPGNVNAVEAVTVVVGRLRPALGGRPDDPGQRGRDAAGHGRRSRRARSWRPGRRPPSGAGNVEVSQRVADVCLGALAESLPGPGAPPPARGR